MNDLISVIIPVYNAAGVIGKCLDSLCGQSYDNLEILVVDDGSKDNSFVLCKEYACRDGRIVVLHQENQGVSAARNFGLEQARGDYIAFVDADDYVKPDYIAFLYEALVRNEADMACCNMIEMQEGVRVALSDQRVSVSRRITNPVELYQDSLLQKEQYGNVVWAKLMKVGLAKKHRFPRNLKFGEDQIYLYKLFSENPVVYLDTYEGYYYIRNDASATCRKVENNIARYLDEMEMHRYKAKELPAYADAYRAGYYERYSQGVYLAGVEILTKGHGETACLQYAIIRERIQEIPFSILCVRSRVKMGLLRYVPGILRIVCGLKTTRKKNV